MALQTRYKQFLSSPAADLLTEDASIHYMPTLSSINGGAAIMKHLASQARQIKKLSEDFLSVVEGVNSLCIEMETKLKFEIGGGTYLPGLDDNFLADRTVTFPVVHIVLFNAEDKIEQVRLYWDQGALLKAIEIIGSRSRGWPLNVGEEQVKLIATAGKVVPAAPVGVEDRVGRSRSRFGANGDKYASLSLFQPRNHDQEDEQQPALYAQPPRESAKPPPRQYGELFVNGEGSSTRDASPKKNVENPLKGGAGHNFKENRLFDPNQGEEGPTSPEKSSVRTHPKKYEHFEFGEAPAPVSKPASRQSKHASQWDFSDFVTPSRPKTKNVPEQNARHFGWSDDEDEASKPEVRRKHIPQPRPDQIAQFEIKDEMTKEEEAEYKAQRPSTAKTRGELYNDQLLVDDDQVTTTEHGAEKSAANKPLKNITNMAQHMKNFGTQFEIVDQSPGPKDDASREEQRQKEAARVPESRKKVVNSGMTSSWSLFDEDDTPVDKPRGIKIAGNGQGSRIGGGGWWEFDEAEGQQQPQ